VLVMPDYAQPFELIADACGFGIGAVLLQEGRPIAFLCTQFYAAESNYTVGEQELLAVVHAMRTWRCYLEGVSADMFTVVTDHNPLTYLQTQTTLSRRQARWSENLQMFTFKWQYRPGLRNVADPLSRSPSVVAAMLPVAGSPSLGKCCAVQSHESQQQLTFRWVKSRGQLKVSLPVPHDIKVTASLAVLTRSQVRPPVPVSDVASPDPAEAESEAESGAAAEAELEGATVIEHVPDSDLTEFQQKCIAGYAKDPYFSDELRLSHLTKLKDLWWSNSDKLVIPDAFDLRQLVMCEMHDSPYRGHVGIKKTEKAIGLLYFWPTLAADVECYVKHCPCCQKMKSTNQKPAGLLQPLPIPTRRWGSVSMDLITSLPETRSGNTAIVAFVDRLTKMTHLAACSTNIGAEAFAKLFRHQVFRLHGLPYELISDRDPRFTSHFMTEVCRLLNIKQGMSTAYHPQTDGQTERTNRTLEEMLRHFVNPVHDDWDEHLPMVEFAINDAWQESTHETPFVLNYGQHPLNPMSLQTHSRVPAAATYIQ